MQPHPAILEHYNVTAEDYIRLRPAIRDMDYCDTDELVSMYPTISQTDWYKLRRIEQTKNPFSSSSIRDQKISGSKLLCECRDVTGIWKPSEIDLDSCIASQSGKLVWEKDGNFSKLSKRWYLKQGYYLVVAQDGITESQLYLPEKIWNDNGRLRVKDV